MAETLHAIVMHRHDPALDGRGFGSEFIETLLPTIFDDQIMPPWTNHGSTIRSVGRMLRKSEALRVMMPWNRSAKAAISTSAKGRFTT